MLAQAACLTENCSVLKVRWYAKTNRSNTKSLQIISFHSRSFSFSHNIDILRLSVIWSVIHFQANWLSWGRLNCLQITIRHETQIKSVNYRVDLYPPKRQRRAKRFQFGLVNFLVDHHSNAHHIHGVFILSCTLPNVIPLCDCANAFCSFCARLSAGFGRFCSDARYFKYSFKNIM